MKNNQHPGLISIVIPVYNSQDTIGEVCQIIQNKMNEKRWDFEIILVDDHSNSETKKVTETLKKEFCNQLKLIRLSKNFGQNSATLCGIDHAKGELIVTIDDDLDYPPEEVVPLIQEFLCGSFDVIYGYQKKHR
jgi:glycosyltransferase involved in cell wall biosynthesis